MTDALFDVDQPPTEPEPEYTPEPPDAVFRAFLGQSEPYDRERGWLLMVHHDRDAHTHEHYRDLSGAPNQRITRPGLRAPTLAQRREVLAKLGFEPTEADTDSPWEWRESPQYGKATSVTLFAVADVRRICPRGGEERTNG